MMVNKNMQLLYVADEDMGFFNLEIFKPRGRTKIAHCVLHQDRKVENDGILWGMQKATFIKAHYDERDLFQRDMAKNLEPLQNGEVVYIVGTKNDKDGFYKVEIIGDYATTCEFIPVCDHNGNPFK